MIGLPASFRYGLMGLRVEDFGVGMPKIVVRNTPFIRGRNPLPEFPTTPFAVVFDIKRNDLSGPSAQGDPDLPLVPFVEHKRPPFVQF
jgi:hypothetical protein